MDRGAWRTIIHKESDMTEATAHAFRYLLVLFSPCSSGPQPF